MPDLTPTGAVDTTVERQLRRVRRRHNLFELQRGLYFVIAAAGGGGALLVPLALATSTRLFAASAWSVATIIGATTVRVVFETRRRWMRTERTAAWVDRRSALGGRLASLVEMRARGARTADAFFLPLLVQENLRRLPVWRANRLVPRPVPLGALATALAAAGALLLALALAPGLRPDAPEITYSDRPIDGLEADASSGNLPARVIVAPARSQRALDGSDQPATADAAEESALARIASELQERIRREIWGKAWERVREAMARARRAPGDRSATADGAPSGDDFDQNEEREEWEQAALPPELGERRRTRGGGASYDFVRRDEEQGKESPRTTPPGEDEGESSSTGESTSGAGNDTDPHLFGPPTDVSGAGGYTFELAIAAPMRARRGGSRRAAGEPPPAVPDARPELAGERRDESTVRKMVVPPAYEAIVREVFAHRETAGDARP